MRKTIFLGLLLPIIITVLPVHAYAAEFTVTPVGSLRASLQWVSDDPAVKLSYREEGASSWIDVAPEGMSSATPYGGVDPNGMVALVLPASGSYQFRLVECDVVYSAPSSGSGRLACGSNQPHISGIYNGEVININSMSFSDHASSEYEDLQYAPPFVDYNQIKLTPVSDGGDIAVRWKIAGPWFDYVDIAYRNSSLNGTWQNITPGSMGFPTKTVSVPYTSETHTAILSTGDVQVQLWDQGTYQFRMQSCYYDVSNQQVPGHKVCSSYSYSNFVEVSSFDVNNLPPVVEFITPSEPQKTTVGDSIQVRVVAKSSEISEVLNSAREIVKVDFYLADTPGSLLGTGDPLATSISPTDGSYDFHFTANREGDFYLVAVATDSAGEIGYAIRTISVAAPETEGAPTAPENNTPLNLDRYKVFYGDFDEDEDGYRDLYFHGLPLVLILHGEVATPIVLEPPTGFAFFGTADGGYTEATPWDMTDAAVESRDGAVQGQIGKNYVLGDMDGDGHVDILVLAEDADHSSLLIRGTEGEALPEVLLEITRSGHTRRLGQPHSEQPYFTGNLADQNPQIIDGQIVVGGTGRSLSDLEKVVSDEGAAKARDDQVESPAPPQLPQPSLTAVELAEIDSLGGVKGEFRVNESGAATYGVPLVLPAGTAGVAPEVSLNYSSMAGVGNMGLGWSLSAGSQISRCRQTLHTDGKTLPIQFNNNDRFCLNGQRMLLVEGQKYGDVGAKYKLEIDNGLMIDSIGGTKGHPQYFVMKARDGSISFFGQTQQNAQQIGYASAEDSTPQVDRVMSWHVSVFEDRAGNKIEYTYERSVDYHRLKSIRYAFGLGDAPTVEARLSYSPRKKADSQWIFGSYFSNDSLLKRVEITDGGELIREYRINYNGGVYTSGDDALDRVTSIRSCLGNHCSQPLKLKWGFASKGAAGLGNGKVNQYIGDLFRSNVSGIARNGFPAERIESDASADNDGDFGDISLTSLDVNYHSHVLADIDGNGFPDLVVVGKASGSGVGKYQIYVKMQDKDGFGLHRNLTGVDGDPIAIGGRDAPQLQPVDFNADGRSDLAIYSPVDGNWRTYLSSPQVSGEWHLKANDILPSALTDSNNAIDDLRFADMNSDGLVDAVYTHNGELFIHHLKRKRASSESEALDISKDPEAYEFAEQENATSIAAPLLDIFNFTGAQDLNEDGRVDILAMKVSTGLNQTLVGSVPQHAIQNLCTYKIDLQLIKSDDSGSFSLGNEIPVVSSAFLQNMSVSSHLISGCDLVEMRRRLVGPYLVDIDSDSLLDIVWAFAEPKKFVSANRDEDPEYHFTSISYRKGLPSGGFASEQTHSLSVEARGFQLLDMDLDGDQDLLISGEDDVRWISYWGTDSFGNITNYQSSNSEGKRTSFEDINADGYIDTLTIQANELSVKPGVEKQNNIIVQFETGMGAVSSVFYEPLRDSGRYDRMTGITTEQVDTEEKRYCVPTYDARGVECSKSWSVPVYAANSDDFYLQTNEPFHGVGSATDLQLHRFTPAQELLGSMPVVTRVASSAPTNDQPNALVGVDYRYEGMKIQAGGRGFLGFKKLSTMDLQSGVTTETTYRQDWPFTGSPIKTVTKTSGGHVLNESSSRMDIFGFSESNIDTKRLLAQSGTANLGPLVLYNAETKDTQYDVDQAHLVLASGEVADEEIYSSELSEVVTTIAIDEFGNTTNTLVETHRDDGGNRKLLRRQSTNNEYYSGEGLLYGRLRNTTVITERPGGESHTRTAQFTYYNFSGAACAGGDHLWGMLCSEKTSSSDLTNSEEPEPTYHYYDEFGNKSYTKTGVRVSPLTDYDGLGRYQDSVYHVFRSAVGSSESIPSAYAIPDGAIALKVSEVLVRDKFGNSLLSRSRSGIKNWVYSVNAATPRGNVYFQGDSTGNFEQTAVKRTLVQKANWCPFVTAYVTSVTQAGGAEASSCHDSIGKKVGDYKVGFDGEIIRTRTDYDVLGRAKRVFEAAKNAAPSLYTETEYDILGRPLVVFHSFSRTDAKGVKSSAPATTRYNYNGLETTTIVSGHTDGQDRTKIEVKNGLGQLVSVTEEGSRSIEYKYDVSGNLESTMGPSLKPVEVKYNGLGQKISMSDPDKGQWSYHYNSYGEMIRQYDDNGTETITDYDFKGRKRQQQVNAASGYQSHQVMWRMDTAPHGLGKPEVEIKYVGDEAVFTRQYGYDPLGRSSKTITTFKGGQAHQESHHQKVTYDQYGRVSQTFDAARTGPQYSYNGIQNVYNQYGYMTSVEDAAGGGSAYFYKVTSMDARGNVTGMEYGNGEYVNHYYDPETGFLTDIRRTNGVQQESYSADWDHFGNLTTRSHELLGGTVEKFKYDKFNRLVSSTLGEDTVTVNYNALDNIVSKSDVEDDETYNYNHADQPHALTKVGSREFTYDGNGNLLEEFSGQQLRKEFSYTGNNLVKSIEVFGADGHLSEFFYGSDNKRFKRVDTNSAGDVTTTLYLGGVEKVYYPDGSVQWKRTIGGVVQVTHEVTADGGADTGQRNYFHRDHLGSVVAITDAFGAVEKRMAFDPWGARRAISNDIWQPSAMTNTAVLASYAKTTKPITSRGFTGHEMLDEVGIVHMNGRIYDATLGRFLQADPIIQEPTMVGSLNRYSYTMNNPLNAVDPSGFSWLSKTWKKAWKEIKPFASVVVSAALIALTGGAGAAGVMGSWFMESVAHAALLGMISGGVGAAVNGQNVLKGAIVGGVSAAAFYGVGSMFRDGGALGGWSQTSVKGFLGRGIAHGTVGGILSELQGGKFGHGFASSGIGKAFSLGALNLGANEYGQFLSATIAGGTSTQITGGKFSNGASSAAMAFLLNQAASAAGGAVREAAQKGQEIGATVKYSWQDLEGNHEYGLRTALCKIDSCSPADVFVSVNKLSVPFTDDYHDGIHYLAGGNPIDHIADFENLNSWNIAKPGHIFPGYVQHSVDVFDGVVYVQSRGVGTPVMPNSPMSPIYATVNNFVGLTAFGSMHNELKQKY